MKNPPASLACPSQKHRIEMSSGCELINWTGLDRVGVGLSGMLNGCCLVLLGVSSQMPTCLVNVVLEGSSICIAVNDWFCKVSRYVCTHTRFSYKDFLFQRVYAKFYPRYIMREITEGNKSLPQWGKRQLCFDFVKYISLAFTRAATA